MSRTRFYETLLPEPLVRLLTVFSRAAREYPDYIRLLVRATPTRGIANGHPITMQQLVSLVSGRPRLVHKALSWIENAYQRAETTNPNQWEESSSTTTRLGRLDSVTKALRSISANMRFYLRENQSISQQFHIFKKLHALLQNLPSSKALQDKTITLLNDETPLIRWRALWALSQAVPSMKLYPPKLVPAMVQRLTDPDKQCREQAARALSKLMEVPELFPACRNELPKIVEGLYSISHSHPNKEFRDIFDKALVTFENDIENSTILVSRSFVEKFEQCYGVDWEGCRVQLARMAGLVATCRREADLLKLLTQKLAEFVHQYWTNKTALYYSEDMIKLCDACTLTPLDFSPPHRVSEYFLLKLAQAYLEDWNALSHPLLLNCLIRFTSSRHTSKSPEVVDSLLACCVKAIEDEPPGPLPPEQELQQGTNLAYHLLSRATLREEQINELVRAARARFWSSQGRGMPGVEQCLAGFISKTLATYPNLCTRINVGSGTCNETLLGSRLKPPTKQKIDCRPQEMGEYSYKLASSERPSESPESRAEGELKAWTQDAIQPAFPIGVFESLSQFAIVILIVGLPAESVAAVCLSSFSTVFCPAILASLVIILLLSPGAWDNFVRSVKKPRGILYSVLALFAFARALWVHFHLLENDTGQSEICGTPNALVLEKKCGRNEFCPND